jgi:hypothetical protein
MDSQSTDFWCKKINELQSQIDEIKKPKRKEFRDLGIIDGFSRVALFVFILSSVFIITYKFWNFILG